MADVEVRCSHSPTVPPSLQPFIFPHPCFPQPTTPPQLLQPTRNPSHAHFYTPYTAHPTPFQFQFQFCLSNETHLIHTYIYPTKPQHQQPRPPPPKKRARRKKIHDDSQPPLPPDGAFLPLAFCFFSLSLFLTFFAKKRALSRFSILL